jgi:sulfur-oxidizing protein SoxZ
MEKKSSTIKIRATVKGDTTTVKALMTHPMETGSRKNSEGELIPAHFIQEINCESSGKNRLKALYSGGVSKNPYLSFKFKGAAEEGDTLTLSWVDNKGESDSGFLLYARDEKDNLKWMTEEQKAKAEEKRKAGA